VSQINQWVLSVDVKYSTYFITFIWDQSVIYMSQSTQFLSFYFYKISHINWSKLLRWGAVTAIKQKDAALSLASPFAHIPLSIKLGRRLKLTYSE
jgi:hypothetical protein